MKPKRIKLSDVKPVKCWSHIFWNRIDNNSTDVKCSSDDVICVLMTSAAFAKLKSKQRDLAKLLIQSANDCQRLENELEELRRAKAAKKGRK